MLGGGERASELVLGLWICTCGGTWVGRRARDAIALLWSLDAPAGRDGGGDGDGDGGGAVGTSLLISPGKPLFFMFTSANCSMPAVD